MHTKINSAPRFLWAVCLVAGLFVLSVEAQDWKILTESPGRNGEKVYWNMKLDADGSDRLMWLKFIPKGKSKLPKGTGYALQRWVLHCGARRMSVSQSIYYNKKGGVIKSNDNPVKRIELAPGSTAEELYGTVCLNG